MEFLRQLYSTVREWILGVEFDNPLIGLAAALIVAVIGFIALRVISLIARRMVARIESSEGTRITAFQLQQQEILSAEEIAGLLTIIVKAVRLVLVAAVIIVSLGMILGFFSWTADLALAALQLTLSTLAQAGQAMIAYIPNFFLVVVIVAIAWYSIRLSRLVFAGIQSERIRLRGFYPEWAMPTFNRKSSETSRSSTSSTRPRANPTACRRSRRSFTPISSTSSTKPGSRSCRRTTRLCAAATGPQFRPLRPNSQLGVRRLAGYRSKGRAHPELVQMGSASFVNRFRISNFEFPPTPEQTAGTD